jgi:hypothetical protein
VRLSLLDRSRTRAGREGVQSRPVPRALPDPGPQRHAPCHGAHSASRGESREECPHEREHRTSSATHRTPHVTGKWRHVRTGEKPHQGRPPCRLASAGDFEALTGSKSQGSPNGPPPATNLQVGTGMHSSTSETQHSRARAGRSTRSRRRGFNALIVQFQSASEQPGEQNRIGAVCACRRRRLADTVRDTVARLRVG